MSGLFKIGNDVTMEYIVSDFNKPTHNSLYTFRHICFIFLTLNKRVRCYWTYIGSIDSISGRKVECTGPGPSHRRTFDGSIDSIRGRKVECTGPGQSHRRTFNGSIDSLSNRKVECTVFGPLHRQMFDGFYSNVMLVSFNIFDITRDSGNSETEGGFFFM